MKKFTRNEFIEKARKVHGDKYDYSKVEYINNKTKVCIICPEHGEFWQNPYSHLHGIGCPKCSGMNKTTEEWIKMAKEVHGNKYDYSKTQYVDAKTRVCIICHEKDKYGNEHGEFWRFPNNHLHGAGCCKCRNYKLEDEIRNILNKNGIMFEEQKSFTWLKIDGINKNGKKTLDFYLPEYNVVIECQGIQHFKPIDFAHKGNIWANEKYKKTIENDKFKKNSCKEHGIDTLYYSNLGIEYPYKVYEDKNKLIQNIINNEDIRI